MKVHDGCPNEFWGGWEIMDCTLKRPRTSLDAFGGFLSIKFQRFKTSKAFLLKNCLETLRFLFKLQSPTF